MRDISPEGLSPDPAFRRIAILGLGLLGGSLGLALKRAGITASIAGYARRGDTRDRALAAGAIDEVFADLGEAVRGADLVILATPVAVILDHLPRLRAHLSPQALITDVGSTKRRICECAAELYAGQPLFLGGHPMAGKELSGLENADAQLFENACYVLTPLEREQLADPRVRAFRGLVKSIGARPLALDPATHDAGVACLSHLPQLLSTSLAAVVEEEVTAANLPLEMAGPGFRDMTRLADSPYSVWRDICLTNTANIQTAIDALIAKLESIKVHLTHRELEQEFLAAHRLRDRLRETS